MSPKRILFLFLDGVGIGDEDPSRNPFFASEQSFFRDRFGSVPSLSSPRLKAADGVLKPIDANLGVDGLPQSGTGQVSILTGENASAILGKHFGPFPYSTLRPVLAERNIFSVIGAKGRPCSYVNAFPKRYFDFMDQRPARMGAFAAAWRMSGGRLNGPEELRLGTGISANLTGEHWEKMGHSGITPITAFQAGERFVQLTGDASFGVLEYYFTDKAGHHQSFEEAANVLGLVNELLFGITAAMDHASTLLIVTSDHGNLEDLSVRTHTRNPVPLIGIGVGLEAVEQCKSITDIAPLVGSLLS